METKNSKVKNGVTWLRIKILIFLYNYTNHLYNWHYIYLNMLHSNTHFHNARENPLNLNRWEYEIKKKNIWSFSNFEIDNNTFLFLYLIWVYVMSLHKGRPKSLGTCWVYFTDLSGHIGSAYKTTFTELVNGWKVLYFKLNMLINMID